MKILAEGANSVDIDFGRKCLIKYSFVTVYVGAGRLVPRLNCLKVLLIILIWGVNVDGAGPKGLLGNAR